MTRSVSPKREYCQRRRCGDVEPTNDTHLKRRAENFAIYSREIKGSAAGNAFVRGTYRGQYFQNSGNR